MQRDERYETRQSKIVTLWLFCNFLIISIALSSKTNVLFFVVRFGEVIAARSLVRKPFGRACCRSDETFALDRPTLKHVPTVTYHLCDPRRWLAGLESARSVSSLRVVSRAVDKRQGGREIFLEAVFDLGFWQPTKRPARWRRPLRAKLGSEGSTPSAE